MVIQEYRGIRGLVAAKILTDTADEITYDTPFAIAGVSELSKETEASSEAHYYDNVPAVVIDSVGADSVTMAVSAIPHDILAKITGQYYDEDTSMFVEGERESAYWAIGYITELTDGTVIYVWRLKGTFNIPGSTHGTKNDGTDATGQELVYTGINTNHKFTKTTKTAKAVHQPAAKAVAESKFFGTVQTPDTIAAATPTA